MAEARRSTLGRSPPARLGGRRSHLDDSLRRARIERGKLRHECAHFGRWKHRGVRRARQFEWVSGLTSHAHDVRITGPNLDTGGAALFPNLTAVTGNVHVEGFFAFIGYFPGLTTVGGNLEIIQVKSMGGFPQVVSIGGDLVLEPKFLSPLTHLSSIGGSLVWQNNAFGSTIDVSAMPLVTAHGLLVNNNPTLTSLDNSVSIVGSGPITITNNAALLTCAAQPMPPISWAPAGQELDH